MELLCTNWVKDPPIINVHDFTAFSTTNKGSAWLIRRTFRLHKLHRQHVDIQHLQNVMNQTATSLTTPHSYRSLLLQNGIAELRRDVVHIIRNRH